jgi:hypothetical protein
MADNDKSSSTISTSLEPTVIDSDSDSEDSEGEKKYNAQMRAFYEKRREKDLGLRASQPRPSGSFMVALERQMGGECVMGPRCPNLSRLRDVGTFTLIIMHARSNTNRLVVLMKYHRTIT